MDSQRLIQRNKNLLIDLLNKQNMERRRTDQFLHYALGARSPGKTKYYRSKLFSNPQESKLKVVTATAKVLSDLLAYII